MICAHEWMAIVAESSPARRIDINAQKFDPIDTGTDEEAEDSDSNGRKNHCP